MLLDKTYDSQQVAQTRAIKLMKDGRKAEVRQNNGRYEVWADMTQTTNDSPFGKLMEAPDVQEAAIEAIEYTDPNTIKQYDRGETYAAPASDVLGRKVVRPVWYRSYVPQD